MTADPLDLLRDWAARNSLPAEYRVMAPEDDGPSLVWGNEERRFEIRLTTIWQTSGPAVSWRSRAKGEAGCGNLIPYEAPISKPMRRRLLYALERPAPAGTGLTIAAPADLLEALSLLAEFSGRTVAEEALARLEASVARADLADAAAAMIGGSP